MIFVNTMSHYVALLAVVCTNHHTNFMERESIAPDEREAERMVRDSFDVDHCLTCGAQIRAYHFVKMTERPAA